MIVTSSTALVGQPLALQMACRQALAEELLFGKLVKGGAVTVMLAADQEKAERSGKSGDDQRGAAADGEDVGQSRRLAEGSL